jgi:hypothetical protein
MWHQYSSGTPFAEHFDGMRKGRGNDWFQGGNGLGQDTRGDLLRGVVWQQHHVCGCDEVG